MASVWNGKELQNYFTEEAGYSDAKSLDRTLKFLNEIQGDIASSADWPNLKLKLKKLIRRGTQKLDVSPQIPEAASIQLSSGGALTTGKACKIKITFVVFDEEEQEYSSIESEPSPASNEITPSDENQKILITNIASFDGATNILPNVIHRRVYLKQGDGPYLLVATLTDNDANQITIDANPSSTIEPPEQSMVEHLSSEDITISIGSMSLSEQSLDEIQKYDPGMTAVGTPQYYARISETKILLYPKPSTNLTITYWVKRRPSRIFAEEGRAIQLNRSLEEILDVGVNWKWLKWKRDEDWQTMRALYVDMKSQAKAEKIQKGGKYSKVKVVC